VPKLPDALVRGALILPDRNAIVDLLPKKKVMVELGVALGTFSTYALRVAQPSLFVAIDTFRLHELEEFWGRETQELFGGLTHGDWYRRKFADRIAAGAMKVIEGDSAAGLDQFDDSSIDIVYVDADHRYDAVKADLRVLQRKMRPDGFIIMDDYILVEHLQSPHLLGVIYATNEFMLEHGWALHYLALQTNTYYQVVLRRAGIPTPATALAQEVAELRGRLARLEASRSWRITAPLRRMVAMSKRIGG
jgi:hypothetical protein